MPPHDQVQRSPTQDKGLSRDVMKRGREGDRYAGFCIILMPRPVDTWHCARLRRSWHPGVPLFRGWFHSCGTPSCDKPDNGRSPVYGRQYRNLISRQGSRPSRINEKNAAPASRCMFVRSLARFSRLFVDSNFVSLGVHNSTSFRDL